MPEYADHENILSGVILINEETYIMNNSDADPDGDSIAGLLINFFGRYWPEMLEQGQICRVMTPLVVVKKGAETLSFYTAAEFEAWQQKQKDLKIFLLKN